MKTPIFVGLVLVVLTSFAHSEPVRNRTQGPCFNVTIQNDPVNESSVQQNCDQNFSRTVQAGKQNWAEAIQTGEVNDNKVRQYQYDGSKYFERMRGDRKHGN